MPSSRGGRARRWRGACARQATSRLMGGFDSAPDGWFGSALLLPSNYVTLRGSGFGGLVMRKIVAFLCGTISFTPALAAAPAAHPHLPPAKPVTETLYGTKI